MLLNNQAPDWAKSQSNSVVQGGQLSQAGLYQSQYNYIYTATIRKVSNGYVLTVGPAEYVFESAESMITKLKEVLEPKNGA